MHAGSCTHRPSSSLPSPTAFSRAYLTPRIKKTPGMPQHRPPMLLKIKISLSHGRDRPPAPESGGKDERQTAQHCPCRTALAFNARVSNWSDHWSRQREPGALALPHQARMYGYHAFNVISSILVFMMLRYNGTYSAARQVSSRSL